jgi:tRNA 2-thiouridine synthesizing protein D
MVKFSSLLYFKEFAFIHRGGMVLVKISVLITAEPYTFQNFLTAYQFAKKAVENGHNIVGIFLYMDSVVAANTRQNTGEVKSASQLLEELAGLGVPIFVCPVCASFRGISDEQFLPKGVKYAGVVTLGDLIADSDKFIAFTF